MPDGNSADSSGIDVKINRWWNDHSQLDHLVEALSEALSRTDHPASLAALEDLDEVLRVRIQVEEESYFPIIARFLKNGSSMLQKGFEAHLGLLAGIDALKGLLERQAPVHAATLALSGLLESFRVHEEMVSRWISDLRRRVSEN